MSNYSLLSPWFHVYVHPTGRREFVLTRMGQIAREIGWIELAEFCDMGVSHEQKVRSMQRTFKTQKNQPLNPELMVLDPKIDRTIGSIYRNCQEALSTLDHKPQGPAAKKVLDKAFPGGAIAVTNLDYIEQNREVAGLLHLFEEPQGTPRDDDEGCLAAEIKTLGLTTYVEVLRERNDRFGELLKESQLKEDLTADKVRAAFNKGQEHLLQAIAAILGRHLMPTKEQQDERDKLLAPVIAQQEQIAQYKRSRRKVRDVNPETGQESPPEDPTETDPDEDEPLPSE